jgi:hypothetical protein
MMKAASLAAFVLALSALPVLAETVSERPDAVSIVIYPNGSLTSDAMVRSNDYGDWDRLEGLAYISETRTVDVEAGGSEIRFRGVASTMVPQTADIQGLPEDALERNFDYDLLAPGSLLAKSIGQTVHLVRTDPKTGRQTEQSAIVRSGPDGAVLEIDGEFEALHCSGLPERLEFDSVPEGLTSTPTLAVRTRASARGHYKIRLSYLAAGLSWSADYVARIHPDGRALDLSGFVTLGNFDSTSFHDVLVQFVGGLVNQTGDDQPQNVTPLAIATKCWPTALTGLYSTSRVTAVVQQEMKFEGTTNVETVVVTGSRIPDPRALGDYKLYSLPEPTDIAANEVKQIGFLDQRNVAFQKVYSTTLRDLRDNPGPDDCSADVLVRLQNRADTGLGKPLPSGTVSLVDTTPAGEPIFAGQGRISNIPVGLPLEIVTGRALDVNVACRVVSFETVKDRSGQAQRHSVEVSIANDKPLPIRFELQQGFYSESGRILSEDKPHSAESDGVRWTFDLNPREHVVFAYAFEQRG